MNDVAVVAFGAVSALGEGRAAVPDAEVGAPAVTRVALDADLVRAGLARPYCARAQLSFRPDRDRAVEILEHAVSACAASLDDALPGWRARRVGLALATSSGGMGIFEQDATRFDGTYLGPVLASTRPVDFAPFSLVLGACASGALAIGVARAWLAAEACDVVLAGGFDAVSTFVAAGFESLRATSRSGTPQPFRASRDGLALGEGAAVLALAREAPRAWGWVRGFGASCDAVHLTAPEPSGAGLARAATAALADAGVAPADIRLVSAHGTATIANDDAETNALRTVGVSHALVTALKGVTGHTLGAAGALEAVDALLAMERRVVPATAGHGPTTGGVRVVDAAARMDDGPCLKLSAAFGGANAALVLARRQSARASTVPPRPAYVTPAVAISDAEVARGAAPPDLSVEALSSRASVPADRLARMDDLVRLCLAVVADLQDRVGSLAGAGILVGHGLATFETNLAFQNRIVEAGAHKAEPRRFPYTTPNAAAGECAIAFGLSGPAFAVGGGAHGGIEALSVAEALVATSVCDRLVVVAVDEGGALTADQVGRVPRGAVALLVSSEPGAARLHATCTLPRVATTPHGRVEAEALAAHLPLLALAGPPGPRGAVTSLASRGLGMIAKATLFWL